MRLRHLFEKEPKELEPGEREPIDVNQFEKLKKINKKISDYEKSLSDQQSMKVPMDQREALEKMKASTQTKLDKLYQRQVEAKQDEIVGGIPKPIYNLLERVKSECSDIMSVYESNNAKFIYRGAKSSQDAYRGRPYEDRQAKDSNQQLSNALNAAFKQAGIQARRDNSIFTSGSYSQASNYGYGVYIIFPKDGYAFSCSEKIKDFVFDFGKLHDHFIDYNLFDELYKELKSKGDDVKKYFNSNHFFIQYGGDKHDLLRKIEDFEIVKKMINDGFIDSKFEPFAGIENVLSPEKVVKNLGMFTDNIDKAIDMNHEITISGEYYAISNKYEQYIHAYIKNNEKPQSQEYTDQLKFARGDKVEVIQGAHIGKTGKIDYIYKMSDDVEVDTGTEMFRVSKKQLKKLEGEKTDTADVDVVNGYKLDDKVKIINGEGSGKAGTISKLLPDNNMVVVKVQTAAGIEQLPKKTDNLEFNNSADDDDLVDLSVLQEPEVGDYIKVDNAKGIYADLNGKVGKIINAFDNAADVKLKGYGLASSVPKKYLTVTPGKTQTATVTKPQQSQPTTAQQPKEPESLSDILSKALKPDEKPASNQQTLTQNFKKLINKGKQAGYVTYDEINKVFPPNQASDDQIEDALDQLSELGIEIVET